MVPQPLPFRRLKRPRDLTEVLILQQPALQFRARVVFLFLLPAREEQLRLDLYQGSRHLDELPRTLQIPPVQFLDRLEELLGYTCDGDVEDVDVLLPDQMQE